MAGLRSSSRGSYFPLGDEEINRPFTGKEKAGDAIRTRDVLLGKEVLYH